jgi:superfamily II DNA/RNA helicase
MAALQQAPIECNLTEPERDAYWTLVAYHNSLRELGKTVTLARDDIPARIGVIADDDANTRDLDSFSVLEMTSNLSDEEIPQAFSRMKRGPDEDGSVSIAACTSMFSVGVDIDRLGLMLVNGQPKTTSEYIQASSRVGRGKVPGLVVMHYAANKPRDRSHYESFIPYHSTLYRNVEPTSVTPFSLPSRERALHAAFVILVRHGVGLTDNVDADRFNKEDPEVQKALKMLSKAVRRMEPEESEATERQLENIASEWHHRAQGHSSTLYYNSGTRSRQTLLRNFGESREGWATLHSMRNVDRQCEIKVIGE